MNIKGALKKTWIGKVKQKLNRKGYSKDYFSSYQRRYMKYSATDVYEKDERYLRLRIIISTHSVEKGLSHNDFRAGFGKDTVKSLYLMLLEYVKIPNYDQFVVENGCAVLYKYHLENQNADFDDSDYLRVETLPIVPCSSNGGAKIYNIKEVLQMTDAFDFAKYSSARASVRIFDKPALPIDDKTLINCVAIAQNAPNACNRQSIRVHIVRDKKKFSEIEQVQLGCKGFAVNASAFVFITNDLSLYECSEVKLPVFDAGMFTMNLVYSLFDKGIFSCVLNASFPEGSAESEIRKIAHIPENEMINGLLVIYKIDEDAKIKVPVSIRRTADEICTFAE